MKTRAFILFACMLGFGLPFSGLAQSTIFSSSGAKVGTELSLVQNSTLHFGTMTIPTAAVNVVLSTSTIRTASVPSAITLLAQAPVPRNAAYTVYGSKNAHYLISVPPDNTVQISSGSNHMYVNTFTVYSASNGAGSFSGKLSQSGTDTFMIGATLKCSAGQPAGAYSGTFTISVVYN